MNKIKRYILFILLALQFNIFGQEVLKPLIYNPAYNKTNKNQAAHILKSNRLKSTGLSLPFFDDFSYDFADTVIYPDANLWDDSDVYINSSFCKDPITIGVATFDALDKNGILYPQALTNSSFIADKLTSKPILLGSYQPKDSVYLSFYYQPGGLGDPPDTNDSLMLLFLKPLQKNWDTIWWALGGPVMPFQRVTIPLTDTAYFHDGFQFRFLNYASISFDSDVPGRNGNGDIWNLDYVQLGSGRSMADTVLQDLAIINPLYSPLRDFESMPWSHFQLQNVYSREMAGGFNLYVRNNDTTERNTERSYLCKDLYENTSYVLFPPEAVQAKPGEIVVFNDTIQEPLVSNSSHYAKFKITAILKNTSPFDPKSNDTVVYYQNFENYYSYDDGTAEFGYGIEGVGTGNAMVAYKFPGYMRDSLQAVDIFFNRSYKNDNYARFYLTVWDSKNGYPDQILYKKDSVYGIAYKPDTLLNGLNTFKRYYLDTAIVIPDTFFVGWTQTKEVFMNVGFDMNKNVGYDVKDNSRNRIYYSLGNPGDWTTTTLSGALMIRPVLGNYKDAGVSVRNLVTGKLEIYPNPAIDRLNIKMSDNSDYSKTIANIFDLTGKMVLSRTLYGQSLDISALKPGIYLLRLQSNTGTIYNGKVVISPR